MLHISENYNSLLFILNQMSNDDLVSYLEAQGWSESLTDISAIKKNIIDKLCSLSDKRLDQELIKKIINKLEPNTIESMKSQKVQIKITPLDKELKPLTEQAIEINSYYINKLVIEMLTSGFIGNIHFIYPYQTEYPNKLLEVLNNGMPLEVEVKISQEFSLTEEEKEFISSKGDNSNQLLIFKMYASHVTSKSSHIRRPKFDFSHSNTPLVTVDPEYAISCCDSMKFHWSQVSPVRLYSGQSYIDIIQEVNEKFSNQLIINYDQQSSQILGEKKPFITLNCSNYENGFYDFIRYIAQEYNLQIIYNYDTNSYLFVADQKAVLDKSKVISSFSSSDKKNICSININHEKPYCQNQSLVCMGYDSSTKSQLNPTSRLQVSPETIPAYETTKTTVHDLPLLFNLKKSKLQTEAQLYSVNTEMGVNLVVYSMPVSYSIFPYQNSIVFSKDEWSLLFGSLSQNMAIHKSIICIEKIPTLSANGKRHPVAYEYKHNGKVIEHTASFEYEDTISEKVKGHLLFNVNCEFEIYNIEKWPTIESIPAPDNLIVMGEIYTTKSDQKDNTHNSELFTYSADSSESTNYSTSYNCSGKTLGLDPNCQNRPRYQVVTAAELWTELTPEAKQLIPVDVTLPAYSNFLFYFKAGTKMKIRLFTEYAELESIVRYLAPNDFFSNGEESQIQGFIFEDRQEQKTVIQSKYEPKSKNSQFTISHTPNTENSTPSTLEIDNTAFRINVGCDGN